MNEILVKQLAIDFCTEEGAVTSRENSSLCIPRCRDAGFLKKGNVF